MRLILKGFLNMNEASTDIVHSSWTHTFKKVAGAPGFEPGYGGTKNRCLTAWRRPN